MNKTKTVNKTVLSKEREEEEEEYSHITFIEPGEAHKPALRLAYLYGDVDEEQCSDIAISMLSLHHSGKEEGSEAENSETPIKYEPFKFYISTAGGSAADMFSLYDTMRLVREDCEIHTIGMGKVMSAGVLLLAAGTKGKRMVGANCRIMLHSVMGLQHGSLHSLENEMEEMRWVQKQHIKALVSETSMTEKHLKRLLNKKINVYLNAEEAIEHGIADIII